MPSVPTPDNTALVQSLHAKIQKVCPILGVRTPDPSNKATWAIDFDPTATGSQQTAAAAVITGFSLVTIVPVTVELWQFRAYLDSQSLFNSVNSYVNAHQNTIPNLYHYWNVGHDVGRYDVNLGLIQTQLGFTDAQMDTAFVNAAAITP